MQEPPDKAHTGPLDENQGQENDLLHESEVQYRQLFENIPVGIGIADQNGYLLAFNDAMLVPGGYSRRDIHDMSNYVMGLYYDPRQRAIALATFQRQGFLKRFPVKFKRKDNTPYDALLSLAAIQFRGQACIQALVEDITERKQAEEALRQGEKRLANIIGSAMDAIISIDEDQRIILFNTAAELIFQCSGAEALGERVDRFIPSRFRDAHHRQVTTFGRSHLTKRTMESIYEATITGLRANGTEFPAEASISQTETAGKKVYTVILRDITERKKAEKLHEALLKISNAAISLDTLEELYLSFHHTLQSIMLADNFYIALYDPLTNLLSFPYFVDEKEQTPESYPPDRGLTGYVLQSREPLLGKQEVIEKLMLDGKIESVGVKSIDWLGVPLNVLNKTIGVMAVQTYEEGVRYTQRELDILTMVSSQVAQSIERKRAEASLRESEKRYRTIFESAGVPIWEEDYSEVMAAINSLKEQGITDFQHYLAEHPDFIAQATHMIKVLDMNQAAINMLRSNNKAEVLVSLDKIFGEQIPETFRELLLAFAEGRKYYENESYVYTKQGERRDEWLTITLPAEDDKYDRVLVSTLDITERKNRERELEAIATVSTTLRAFQSRAEMLTAITEQTMELASAEGVALLLLDPVSQEAVVEVVLGKALSVERGSRIPPDKGVVGYVIKTGQPYMTNNLPNDPLIYFHESFALKSLVALPLTTPNQTIGALQIFRKTPFLHSLMPVLTSIANMAANAIQRISLYEQSRLYAEELSQAYEETLTGWARALELRDGPTESHTRRVVDQTLLLCRHFNIPEVELEHIRRGAILHDIGKMGIPDAILLKPGALTPVEKEIMHRHPQYAYNMLSSIPFLQASLDIPFCHHEYWNGNGYPRGLRGRDIPLAARIFAVVDVWDALRSDRPYRKAWPKGKALKYIRDQSGRQFDPMVVEKFLTLEEIH